MKKFSKILCAVLVIAVLCSSLIFLVGAEESVDTNTAASGLLDGYTAVSMTKGDGTKLFDAVKYPADDNLLTGADISDSNDTDSVAWGDEGGRGSDLITHTASGNVFYKEYLVGSADGKYGDLAYGQAGNDFINYKFTTVDLTKEEGYNKYMVVDFDFAYQGTPDALAFQVITRGNGAYWAITQQLRNLGVPADSVAHVTAVYDYASGNAYMFVDGKYHSTVANGALNETGVTDYANGVTMGASEFRVGSNSSTTLYFDNLYIRSVKNETSSDDLGTALAQSSIAGWSGNVYDASYTSFSLPYFVKTLNVSDYANNILTGGSDIYIGKEAGNGITYIGVGNNTNSPFLTTGSAGFNPYLVAYCNTTTSYNGANNNLFFNANVPNTEPFTVIGDGAVGYYVIDFDVATHGNMLPGFDVSVVMRRNSDKSGYPFSDEIYVGNFVTASDAWAHVTIVGDIANNVAKVYVNGQYAGDAGKAVRNDQTDTNKLGSDTQVVAQGFRIELTRNNIQTDVTVGDNVAFDNFSHRLFVADNYSDLASALADGNITDWANYSEGRTGEKLPTIAVVNGVEYKSMKDLETALSTNETLTVEFLGQPVTPITLRASATVNTHGMNIDDLISFSGDAPTVDGNYYTFVAPYTANREDTPLNFASGSVDAVTSAIKGNAANNVFANYSTVTAGAWNTDGYRNGTLVTNPFTGEVIYRESATAPETPAANSQLAGANEYTNFYFSHPGLSYEEGKNEYIVMDFDFAYEGELSGRTSFSVIPRNAGSGRWSTGVVTTKIPLNEGEMVHITAVHDYTNNKAYYFINGELGLTVNGGAINDAGYSEYKGGKALTISEFKLGSNSLDTYYIDNMNIRVYDLAVADDTLDDAISTKDITNWTDNIYTDSYKVPQIPAIATVNGVEYNTPANLQSALHGNDAVNVELLHAFDEQIVVSCPAVINTNGLANGFVACEGGNVTENGKVLTFTAPYSPNDVIVKQELAAAVPTIDSNGKLTNNTNIQSGNALFDAVYYNAEDNLFSKINYVAYQYENFRAAYLIENPDNGQQYIYDTVYSGDPAGKNTYMNWHIGGPVGTSGQGYTVGADQYILMDFDIAFDKYANTNLNFTTRDSENTNVAGTGFNINEAMLKAGVAAGHFAHITLVGEVDTNTVYVYVNGVKQMTVSNGLSRLDLAEGFFLDGIRGFQNLSVSVKYDNMYMRVVNDSTLKGLNTLIGHSTNVYTETYDLPTLPKFATIDGVDYYSADEVNAVLYGNIDTPKQVEFFHVTEGTVNVSCDAVLDTHGMDIKLNYHPGKVTDLGNGKYSFDCGYVSDTKINNTDATAIFTSAVNVSGNDNIISTIHFDKTGTFMNTGWYDVDGNYVYGVHTYLVETNGMDNVYGMLALPEGSGDTLIGDEWYQKAEDGTLTKAANTTGTYVNLQFNSANNAHYFTYSATENNYWVYDFDVMIDGDALNIFGYNLIKTAGGGFQYGSFDTNYSEYVLEHGNKGAFNHFTIVADYNNNAQYVFLNDAYIATTPLMGENAPSTAYVEGAQYYNLGLRIPLGTGTYDDNDSFSIDNTLARKFVTSNSDNLAAAMAAQDITLWTGRYEYTLPETPVLGTVNGDSYNTTGELEAAIAANENAQVEIVRPIRGAIAADNTATVETNGFCEVVGAKIDGFYEFNAGGRIGTVKASGKYVVSVSGTVYTVEVISSSNYAANSNLVTFYTTPESTATKEVFAFIYGDQIVAPEAITDSGLVVITWYQGDTLVEQFPIASAELGNINYTCKEEVVQVEINTQVSVTVNTNFTVTLYVEATDENGVVVGSNETIEIDGVTYIVLAKKLAANELGNEVVFEYIIAYNDNGEMLQVTQTKVVKVAEYAAELFAGEYADADKTLMYAALAYSNEATALIDGAKNDEFTALLEANVAYAPAAAELGEAVDTSALRDVIRSAALKLDSAPVFVFKVAMGFNGTINFTYNGVTVAKDLDTAAGEQLVYVDGFNAYDIHNDITIEIVVGGETVATGTYNLSTYAQKTVADDNTFATALLTYATVAEAYINTPVEPDEPDTPEEPEGLQYTEIDKANVTSTTLTTIVDGKIKQCEQATLDDGSNNYANGWFTKEGGEAVYVSAKKGDETVEALYFSREKDWTTYAAADQNSGFTESRWAVNANVTSISFDYIIYGTVEEYAGTSQGTDLAGNTQLLSSAFVQLKTGSTVNGVSTDGYPEILNNDLIADGEWHTFTVTFDQPLDTITHFLIKLYHFNGEALIANINIEYAA